MMIASDAVGLPHMAVAWTAVAIGVTRCAERAVRRVVTAVGAGWRASSLRTVQVAADDVSTDAPTSVDVTPGVRAAAPAVDEAIRRPIFTIAAIVATILGIARVGIALVVGRRSIGMRGAVQSWRSVWRGETLAQWRGSLVTPP